MPELKFQPHPILGDQAPSDEEILQLASGTKQDQKLLMDWHEDYHARLQQAEEDPLNHGFSLEHWVYAESMLDSHDSVMCLGGNRCLAGEQEIYDPVAQKSRRVDEIDGDFHVLAWDESTSQVVQAVAQAPFRKPALDLFQVLLGNSEVLRCSKTHKALSFGSYLPIADAGFLDVPEPQDDSLSFLPLSDGYHLLTTWDIGPLASDEDVLRLWQTVQDLQCHCSVYYRHDDGLLHHVLDSDLDASPSPDDVLRRISSFCGSSDGLANKSECIRLYLSIDLLSTLDDLRPSVGQFADTESCASCTPCKSALRSPEDREYFEAHQQSIVEFSHRLQSSVLSGSQGIRFYCISALGGNVNYYSHVVKSSYLRNDTVWDFTVPEYHNYFIGETNQHNSGKTEWGARAVVRAAIKNPGSIIVCFAQDEDASVRIQQSAVYRNLPPEYKKKSKTEVEYVNYTVKNGFTGASLILENGSQILFHKYSQFIANRGKFEGLELGSKEPKWINIGLWLDEYLEDGDLVETMRFRLATRNAKMLMTFTPIDGYTPFVASYLKDVETTKTRPAALLNDEDVPLVQIATKKNAGIVYFHSILNPFGGYERIAKELAHSTRDEILTRAYGIPVKSMTTLFPLFNSKVHVTSTLPDLSPSTHTVYQVVDPAGARNYTSIWASVDAKGYVTILREWPDRDSYGPWAEFGDPKWKFGPASKKMGYDVKGYAELFREIEEELGVEVFERIGDSRYFASENDDNVDLFSQFADHSMHFVPSDGRHEDMGLTALDEWFHYNPNAEVDEANRPIVQLHESCGNLIYSLINYGQAGKKDEPLKDFVDVFRYLRMAHVGDGPAFMGGNAIKSYRIGKGY